MMQSNLSQKLRMLRKAANLTQEAVAKRFNIERQTYCNYENDTRNPPLELIVRLADFYQVSVDYLVRDKVPANSSPGAQDFPGMSGVTEDTLIETLHSLPTQTQKEVMQFIQFKTILHSSNKQH